MARDYLPAAVAAGAIVIDESGYFRMRPDVAAGHSGDQSGGGALTATGIISSPNCSTTQMAPALKPLHDAARVRRVIVSTYQAVSGAGLQGNADLLEGTKAALNGHYVPCKAFAHPIAFNAIPQIGGLKEEGYTSEEMKMVYETRKILGDDSIQISADLRADSGRQLPQRMHHGRDRTARLAGGGPPALRRVPGAPA